MERGRRRRGDTVGWARVGWGGVVRPYGGGGHGTRVTKTANLHPVMDQRLARAWPRAWAGPASGDRARPDRIQYV